MVAEQVVAVVEMRVDIYTESVVLARKFVQTRKIVLLKKTLTPIKNVSSLKTMFLTFVPFVN
jgi:hypothetical protein